MLTRFIDGPAKGAVLNLERCPVFLRVVMDRDGIIDALDQLDDKPKPTEYIYVYKLDGEVGRGIVCSRGKGGGCRSFFHADYKLYPKQPSQEGLRDWDFWNSWAKTEYECDDGCQDRHAVERRLH